MRYNVRLEKRLHWSEKYRLLIIIGTIALAVIITKLPLPNSEKIMTNPTGAIPQEKVVTQISSTEEVNAKVLGVSTLDIQGVYERNYSPISDKIPWLIEKCEELGLDPALIAAIQAEESGWGTSSFCQQNNNCFGYGATDSGNIDYWFQNTTYEEGTTKVLKSLSIWYKVDTAEEMSARGYNSRQSWIDKVNRIKSSFNGPE